MQSIIKKIAGFALAVVAGLGLLISGIWLGYAAGRKVPENIMVTGVANIDTPTSTAANFGTFWEAWQVIKDNYLREPSTTPQQKVYGSINGLVNSLGDPYSEFFDPQSNKQFQEDITGDFGGIGAQLGLNASGDVVVIAPLKGTPAEAAGLRARDIITSINGTSTAGMNVDQAVHLIRGPEGTSVTLMVLRAGWSSPRKFTIMRETIQVPNVQLEMKGDVAHITLAEFTQDAEPAFYQALVKAVDAKAQGIILDLRDNPGGYLEVAVDLSGYFLKPNTLVVKEVGRTVPEQNYKASGDGALSTMPLVVLVNGGSASAAEILAGALHDDRGIKLIGEKTFGKGTVQELEPLSDGSAIKLTVAHWVLPSGRILDHDGLVPDIAVSSTVSGIAGTAGTSTAGVDQQLERALQVLSAEIGG